MFFILKNLFCKIRIYSTTKKQMITVYENTVH